MPTERTVGTRQIDQHIELSLVLCHAVVTRVVFEYEYFLTEILAGDYLERSALKFVNLRQVPCI